MRDEGGRGKGKTRGGGEDNIFRVISLHYNYIESIQIMKVVFGHTFSFLFSTGK